MEKYNNVFTESCSYYNDGKSCYRSDELTTEKSITSENHLHFKSIVPDDCTHAGLLVVPEKKFLLNEGISLIFDLGTATKYLNSSGERDGMIGFAFYTNANDLTVCNPTNISGHQSVLNQVELFRYSNNSATISNVKKTGFGSNLFFKTTRHHGFTISFFCDRENTERTETAPIVAKYKLAVNRKAPVTTLTEGMTDCDTRVFCYEDSLPATIDLSRPSSLSINKSNDMVKIYLNGIWITEFYIGGDEEIRSTFDQEMFMSIFSVGTTTSDSEINLRSVNGISAAQYFSEFREYIEIFNKLTFKFQFEELTKNEIAKLQYLKDNYSDRETYWLNEGLLLRVLAWYEENKEVE